MTMYPLSQQQMHIYISTKLLHSGSLWNMLAIAGYEGGNFDACAFEAALSHVLDNHSLLRSSICDCGNAEVNWVVDSRPVSEYFESVSLVKLDSNAREAAIAQLCEKESSWLFDLESTPLLRCKLVQTDVDKWVVLLNMHRIIGDIESVDIISADLTAAYYRIARGEEVSSHHALPQYSNYVSAQNSAEVSAEDIDYWKAQYETSTPPLNLPLDFTRPPLTDYRIATKAIAVDKELAVDVKECSDRCGVHTSHFLFAAFYFLLAQYSATDDIIIGNHYSDRKHHKCDFSQVVGNFVDTLPVRVHIDLADMTVSDLLKRISSLLTQSHIHRNCPFDKIIEYASPVHDIFRQLLYQAGFNYIEVRSDEREACATELRRTDCRLPIGSCDYADIGVQITSTLNNETIEQMAIDFVYSAGLFAQDTITRMADSLIRILEQMTKVETVREIVLLTAEEMEQVLLAWNDTETQFPSDKCIHHLFEAQAEKTPESVAVVYGEHQLTYQELNIRANRVAHSLLSMGVTPKTHVGICLKPTTDLLVAAIGVLKTGAAYVPLDPAYPQERLQSMVQAADISVLISQKESLKAITVLECTVLNLDEESGPLGAQPAENPNVDADPINAAYIIFTSGSTGTPKGVALCHRGVVNLLNWYVKAYEISASEKVAIISSFSFDLTQKNLFAPLTVGGQVHFLESSLYDPIYISNYIGHNGITLLNCTPSGFYPIADAAAGNDFHDMRSLRCLLLGGESMDIGRLNALCNSKTTSLRLINLYGPTECTDIASSFPIENPADFAKRPAPIGRPIYNGKLYILDKHMRPVPVGVPGELYIGGLGVGRGYINDDDQSRIKFVPNPFVQDSAGYLYKSGDRCRFLADGNIEFLGRMDHQVKIRGFRVELGEVETRLLDHPNVREAVVVAREDQSGEKWLVAYYVPSTEQAPDKGELRAFLLNSLPAYMIPSAFTKLSSIPLTPNGKIDRRSLPAPEDFHLISNVAYTAPRTDTEERVAGIWSRVLKTPAVGVEEDFFEIGGDSLRAVQVLTRLRETFQVEISLLALFEKRTIALIAGELEDLIKANQAAYVDREVLEL